MSTRLLQRGYARVVLATIALVTLAAFENRAVATILPAVAQDLRGMSLFGATVAAPMVTFVAATVAAGELADRRHPRLVLTIGLASFAAGGVLCATAPDMSLLILGRALSGSGEAYLDVGLVVLTARALPVALRPKMFAAFSAAWVLPSVLGPLVAGWVAENWTWRAVFLLPVTLVPLCWLALAPVITRLGRPDPYDPPDATTVQGSSATGATDGSGRDPRGGLATRLALLAGLILAIVTGGASLADIPHWGLAAGLIIVVAGVGALGVLMPRLLPSGTFRARPGVPALFALRTLLVAGFTLVTSYLPLMLTVVHDFSPTRAGLTMTVTGMFWATGSWLNSLDVIQSRTTAVHRLRAGFALVTLGSIGQVLWAAGGVGLIGGLATWGLASIGMGITTTTLATQLLALSPVASQGRNIAAYGLSASVGIAVVAAVAAVGITWRAPSPEWWVFAAIFSAAALWAAIGGLLSTRISRERGPGPAAP